MGVYSGTVPTFLAGELADADKFLEVTNFMTATTAAWTSWAVAWTASAGTPAIGNGTLTSHYRRLGKTIDFRINLTAGTTTTFGTAGAAFRFDIPAGLTSVLTHTGSGLFLDASAGNQRYPLMWHIDASANLFRLWRTNNDTELLNNAPVTMTTSDALQFSGSLEIA